VRRLEEAGIITGYRAELGMDKLGRPVVALIRISAPEQNCVLLSKLVQGYPYVLESYRVTGADRLIVKVAVPSITDLDSILRELSKHGTATASVVLSSRLGSVQPPPTSPLARKDKKEESAHVDGPTKPLAVSR
jgi:Lrp/AsnC family leucine-responsive transcriptional regulator